MVRRFARAALVGLVGCAGGGDPDAPTWTDDIEPLVAGRCRACHMGELPGGGLDLSSDGYAAMVDVPSQQAPDMMLVEPGDALYSYVWHKLNGSQALAGGAGSSMPQGTFLDQDEIDLFARWIDAGAPR